MDNLSEKTNKYWSNLAQDFDAITYRVAGKDTVELVLKELSQLSNLGNMLELGCGTGLYSAVLARRADTLLCTDYSEPMLAICQEKMKDVANITVEKADCCNLPYGEDTFDSVFMANLLHVVPDIETAMKEAVRVLKPGGSLIALDFDMKHMSFFNKIRMIQQFIRNFGMPPHKASPVSDDVMKALFAKHHLTIDFVKIIGYQSKATYGKGIKNEP